jgi:hypothetical protein
LAIPDKLTVDRDETCGKVQAVLPDIETPDEAAPAALTPRRRRRWPWVFLGLFGILVLGLVWLNGPGLRKFGPRVAVHYLQQAGMRGDFKIGGSLTGGLSFSDLTLESDGTLEKVTVARVIPEYQLRGLIKGKLQGLTVEGVQVDLRLGVETEKKDQTPLDLKALVATLHKVRAQVIPLKLELNDLRLTAKREGEVQFQLASSHLYHAPSSDEIRLQLGAITDPTGRVWDGRESLIQWQPTSLTLDRIDPLPGLGLRDLVVQLPVGGEPSAEAQVLVDDAVFAVALTPGLVSAKIDLREGKLQVDETALRFGLELPAKATLTSLSVDADQLLPHPKAAIGSVRLLLEDLVYGEWAVPELSVDAELGGELATVVAHGKALGSDFSLESAVPVTRQESRVLLGNASGKFELTDVAAVVRDLAPRVSAIDADASIPAATVSGQFGVSLTANRAESADVNLRLQPADPQLASSTSKGGGLTTNRLRPGWCSMGWKPRPPINSTPPPTAAAWFWTNLLAAGSTGGWQS